MIAQSLFVIPVQFRAEADPLPAACNGQGTFWHHADQAGRH